MEETTWTCSWSKGGRDPELAEGCDQPAEYLQGGRWVCQDHLDPDEEAQIMRYGDTIDHYEGRH